MLKYFSFAILFTLLGSFAFAQSPYGRVLTLDNSGTQQWIDIGTVLANYSTYHPGLPSPAWLTNGNNILGTAFLGTTNNQPLIFKTNNTETMRLTETGNLGIGTNNPAEKLDVAGNVRFSGALMPNGSAGTTGEVLVSQGAGNPPQWSNINNYGWSLSGNSLSGSEKLGSTNNQPVVVITNNQETFQFNPPGSSAPAWSIQRGGGNQRGLHAVDLQSVRALATQVASGDYSVIGGGQDNTASGSHATVGGGSQNTAGSAGIFAATVGGGYQNTANGVSSTIAGGQNNTASGTHTAIGGGYQNAASALGATISGGQSNNAFGQHATVGGGQNNTAGDPNNLRYAPTVSGGEDNTADNNYATVGGGRENTASGDYSVVPGGFSNTANGAYNLVFGENVDPLYTETHRVYFFGDGSTSPARPSGFLVINRLDGDYPIHVGTNNTNGNGAYLDPGGTWTNSSSRSFKERLVQYRPAEVLEKIRQLPVEGYFYKGTEVYHITPMAEDFYRLFGTGVREIIETDSTGQLVRRPNPDVDKYLAASDVAGVALLGVQALAERVDMLQPQSGALAQRLEALEQENQQIKQENQRLRQQLEQVIKRLALLEAQLSNLAESQK